MKFYHIYEWLLVSIYRYSRNAGVISGKYGELYTTSQSRHFIASLLQDRLNAYHLLQVQIFSDCLILSSHSSCKIWLLTRSYKALCFVRISRIEEEDNLINSESHYWICLKSYGTPIFRIARIQLWLQIWLHYYNWERNQNWKDRLF